jgi:hypothetical protein
LKRNGHALTGSAQKKASRLFSKLQTKSYTQHLQEGEERLWSGVKATIDQFMKKNLLKEKNIAVGQWPEHEIFLLEGGIDPIDGNAKAYISDSDVGRFAAVLSSENLLLNHFRQMSTGMGVFLQIDTSYRYSIERWGLMPVKTVAPTQQGAHNCLCFCVHGRYNGSQLCLKCNQKRCC